MENNLYGINFQYEKKEYKKLCRGKSKKYKNYLEWRDYILGIIDNLGIKALENLRHLCLYQEEIEKHGKEIFPSLAIAFISLYFPLIDNVNNAMTLGGIFAIATFSITYSYLDDTCSMGFYRDVAEIVKEKIESLPEEERLLIKINSDDSQKLLSSNNK